MRKYKLFRDTPITIIDEITLINIDCRMWENTYATQTKVFDEREFIDYETVTNKRDDNFPQMLKEIVLKFKHLVILRSYHRGKVYYAQVLKHHMIEQ